jgi:RNA polymerase sigma-70 factor (ECF subfamily)
MGDSEWLAQRYQDHRTHLRSVAYRMLGSPTEAEDALQGAWLRVARSDASGVVNMRGWLTTIVARECLDMLRSRASRREDLMGDEVPEPRATDDAIDPEHEAVMADSVGLAMLVVLDALTPAERLSFVLHDMFDVPFDEIAPIVGRSEVAARQLASRARRKVQGAEPGREIDPARQREVIDAFLAASRAGDFKALLSLLDPDVVLRSDAGAVRLGAPAEQRGAALVATTVARWVPRGPRPRLAFDLTIADGMIVRIDVIADPERLQEVETRRQDE